MTNYEKYKDTLESMLDDILKEMLAKKIAMVNGVFVKCKDTECSKCDFNSGNESCYNAKKRWFDAEYKEKKVDWSLVPVDTPILINGFIRRHFCKYSRETIWYYPEGRTSWTCADEEEPCRVPNECQVELARKEDMERYTK